MRSGGAVDQETEQLRSTVVAARVHQLLALVDQREVEISNYSSFARADRLDQQASIGCRDRGEATTGDRADVAASVLGNLRLLVGVQPGRGTDDKASRLQCMLPDVDLRLLGEQLTENGARIHSRVDLLAVGHHRVPC